MTNNRPILKQNRPQQTNDPQGQGRNQGNQQNNRQQQGGGGRNDGGNHGNDGNQGRNPPPSPWLDHPLHPNGTPATHSTASFVEYLRWMRSPQDKKLDPLTQLQIMQIAEEKANYQKRLEKMSDRTKRLAGNGNWFEVTCPWRIRVGGTKGPESMLLPAFDALGMPYIPSSTLRGIARTYAIRHFMEIEGMDWKASDRHVEKWFGHLEAKNKEDKSGKVIFFDAYPTTPSKSGGLTIDMANSIWRWEGDQLGGYSPNPNAFFSLKDVSFVIGIRPIKPEYQSEVEQVRNWLILGLAQGAGSQVNSGYGFVREKDSTNLPAGFFELDFEVDGQLVHSVKKLDPDHPFNDKRKANYSPKQGNGEELRSVAIKNMMRYWFRVFALGILPSDAVKTTEKRIFGGIDPKTRGCLSVYVFENASEHQPAPELNRDGKGKNHGKQKGKMILIRSSEPVPNEIKDRSSFETSLEILAKELVWLSFHLGGVGQGARRPLYSRNNRRNGKPPWWRGSTLAPTYSNLFKKPQNFAKEFREHLESFYAALDNVGLAPRSPLRDLGQPSDSIWTEAADAHCQIWLVPVSSAASSKPNPTARPPKPGQSPAKRIIGGEKSQALRVLHDLVHPWLKIYEDKKKSEKDAEKREAFEALTEAKNRCGHTDTDYPNGKKREATPSPIWIADHGNYQVVTVFGATQNPRRQFVEALQGATRIFPLTSGR